MATCPYGMQACGLYTWLRCYCKVVQQGLQALGLTWQMRLSRCGTRGECLSLSVASPHMTLATCLATNTCSHTAAIQPVRQLRTSAVNTAAIHAKLRSTETCGSRQAAFIPCSIIHHLIMTKTSWLQPCKGVNCRTENSSRKTVNNLTCIMQSHPIAVLATGA